MTVPGFRCICHNEIYNKAPTSSYFSVSKTGIYIFSQFPFVFLTQIFKIRIYAYSSTVQFYDNYFRSIVNSHWNNTVSNTSAHNHSCSILCIGACVIFREKSLARSNNSSPKWQSKFLHKFTSPHPISIQCSIFRFHQYFQF